jgi:hypothetical protein
MLDSRENILKKNKTEYKNNNNRKIENQKEIKKEETKGSNIVARVTKEIPEFIGTDEKKYNLRINDVLSLPENMSKTLEKRGVIEKVDYLP